MSVFDQPLKTSQNAEKQDILSSLLDTLRSGITPFRGICAASDLLFSYYDCQGALLKSTITGEKQPVSEKNTSLIYDPFKSGPLLSSFLDRAILQHMATPNLPKEDLFTFNIDKISILACYQALRQNEWALILLWRKAPWQKNDKKTITLFWKMTALLMEMENLYLTAIKKTRHDPATGVLTWPALCQTITRRFPRLDRDGLAGTLILVQVNGLSAMALTYGPEMEERILTYSTAVLEHTIRPTDLIGRIGGPLFVIWLDGADRYAAAERAETITKQGIVPPFLQKTTLSLQMGLCCREPLSMETTEELLEQAMLALKKTTEKKTGRLWYFAHQNA